MKSELSAVDVHFLVQELQFLVGARVQKAYGLGKDEVFLQFHKEGKHLLRIKLPCLAYLAEQRPEFPKNPSGFIMFLRKRLNNARVKKIRQLGMDRIIVFDLAVRSKGATAHPGGGNPRAATTVPKAPVASDAPPELILQLIIELVAPGNVLLIGRKPVKGGKLSEPVILHLLQPQSYKDRTLRGGIAYEAPPAPNNIKEDPEDKLIDAVAQSGMDMLVKALASGLSLGGEYAELVCTQAKLDKTKATCTTAEIKKAIAAAKKLLKAAPKPAIINDEVVLFPEEKDKEGPAFDTISAALETAFGDSEVSTTEKKAKKGKKGTIIEQQARQKEGLEKSSVENQQKGELIYEHYQEISKILAQVKAGEEPDSKFYKKFDKKTGTLTIEF